MKPRGTEWQFALLLLILLTTMALGPSALLQFVLSAAHIPLETARTLNWSLLALSSGFLFMTGGLGLWAYRATLEREGEKRVGQAVGSMDALRDGLIAVDRQGGVSGANAAARSLADRPHMEGRSLAEAFACLSPPDVALLLEVDQPVEIERIATRSGESRILRFRAQPGPSGLLLLVGDVTEQAERRRGELQRARLQLIGRIARGVAHDFNNVLCAVSGHAELLSRLPEGQPLDRSSLEAIQKESDRGALLARRLLDISRDYHGGIPADDPSTDVSNSLDLLAAAMRRGWKLCPRIGGPCPPVSLTPSQVEQIVLSLGIGAVSRSGLQEGFLHLHLHPSEGEGERCWDGSPSASFVLVVFASPLEADTSEAWKVGLGTEADHEEMGVIESVIRGMVEGAGGRFEVLHGPERRSGYRISLPCSKRGREGGDPFPFNRRLRERAAGQRVLLGFAQAERARMFVKACESLDMSAALCADLPALMHQLASEDRFVGVLVEGGVIGDEAEAFQRILKKLQPGARCIVLPDPGRSIPQMGPAEALQQLFDAPPRPNVGA